MCFRQTCALFLWCGNPLYPLPESSEEGSASISVEHELGILTVCPITAPLPFSGSKQGYPATPDTINIVAPATASRLDEATSAPSLPSLNTFDQRSGGTHPRFPEVRQEQRRCRRERQMGSTAFLNQAGFAAAAATGQVGKEQKVSVRFIAKYEGKRAF